MNMIKIIRSKRKSISISINSLGSVTVNAPLNMKDSDIQKFINSKSKWIKTHLDKKNAILTKNEQILRKEKGLYLGKTVNFSDDYNKKLIKTARESLPKRTRQIAEFYKFQC
ncbi:MAG: DUF45 domain-containing protein [Clostridia bacterium]|nr:DUF45 domain-containing protein [Clostridia bacterium]